jgi:hypothetical protein
MHWFFTGSLVTESLTSQLVLTVEVTGKNVLDWGSSTAVEENYQQILNYFFKFREQFVSYKE